LTETEVKIKLFKVFYRSDFDEGTLNRIAENMKEFLIRTQSPA